MYRIGQSTDIHQLVKGRDFILGGIKIESDKGLLGHSDADVLVHAMCESIIGALGLGDIGKHFPDTDSAYKGISSLILLRQTIALMRQQGYDISNMDTLVLCEEIKINPHIEAMKNVLCPILGVAPSALNIKATRGEKMGFIGRGEGVMAQAVVLLKKNND